MTRSRMPQFKSLLVMLSTPLALQGCDGLEEEDTANVDGATSASIGGQASTGSQTSTQGGADASSSSTSSTSSGGPFDRNPKLADLPANTWTLLDEAGIELDGHFAYSGGSYDRNQHQFLVFGGGHWDGWRNDVLAFDIPTATWRQMYQPTSADDYTCSNVNATTPGMLLSSSMPASRHSYDQIQFLEHIGKTIVWSGPTYSSIWTCPGNTMPEDTWFYDAGINSWEYRNTARGPQPSGEAMSGAYDPIGKKYYAYPNVGMWVYDDMSDQWSDLAPTGESPGSYDLISVIDRKRQRIYRMEDAELYVYDILANTWRNTNATGEPPSDPEFSLSFDERRDVLLAVSNDTYWAYDILSNQWISGAVAGGRGGDVTSSRHVYERFFYDPVDEVHLLITQVDYRAQTWAYRFD
jgi:hypothetical protein